MSERQKLYWVKFAYIWLVSEGMPQLLCVGTPKAIVFTKQTVGSEQFEIRRMMEIQGGNPGKKGAIDTVSLKINFQLCTKIIVYRRNTELCTVPLIMHVQENTGKPGIKQQLSAERTKWRIQLQHCMEKMMFRVFFQLS